jgi:hypothetical protein
MPQPRVAVIGIGSLRAGPHIAAALASCPSDERIDIRLWDGSGERLDLFDRFLSSCLEVTDYGHRAESYSNAADALAGNPAIILCLHEDGARRHLQPPPATMEDAEVVQVPETSMSIVEFGLGDPNRPTPRSRLSDTTRSVVFQPDLRGSREEVILRELEMLRPLLENRGPLLNLTRGIASPDWLKGETLDWPEPLDEATITSRPHQVLRWTQGDPSIAVFVQESWKSPISQWLERVI